MKATGQGKKPRIYIAESYADKIKESLDKNVIVKVFSNNRAVKTYTGAVEYIKRDIFGLRILCRGEASYVMSVSYADIFTGKITVDAVVAAE